MAISTGTGLALSAAGGLLGGVMGGKKQTATQETRPYISENHQKGLDTLYEGGMDIYNTPFTPGVMSRAQAPTDIFGMPEVYKLQQKSDAMGGLLSPMRTTGQNINKPVAEATKAADPTKANASTNVMALLSSIASNPAIGFKANQWATNIQRDPAAMKIAEEALAADPSMASNPSAFMNYVSMRGAGR